MPPEALLKLKQKLTAIDEAVTIEELKKAIEAMLKFSVNLQTKTESDLGAIKKAVDGAISRMNDIATSEAQEASQTATDALNAHIDELMNKIRFEHEAMLSEASAKLDALKNGEDGADGVDADEEVVVKKVLSLIPKPLDVSSEIKDIRDRLDQLGIGHIKGWEDAVKKLIPGETVGATRGFALRVGGAKKGLVNEVNFTGSGVSHSLVGGLPTITITGGSSATIYSETPTGAIDGVNTAYTTAHAITTVIGMWINGEYIHPSEYTAAGSGFTMGTPLPAGLSGKGFSISYT